MNPALLAYLAQVTGGLQPSPNPVVNGMDPLAPTPDQQPAPVMPAPADSMNDGINSVGRPADVNAADQTALAASADKRSKALKKAQREAKGEALMAFGAQLMSSRTFGEGLAKGLVAYRQALDAGKKRNEPTRESVDNGAFERVIDPLDNTASYERTPVADYEEGKAQAVTDRMLQVAGLKGDYGLQIQGSKNTGAMDRTTYTVDHQDTRSDRDRTSKERIAGWANTSRETVARINGEYRGKNRAPNKLEVAAQTAANNAPDNLARYDRIDQMLDTGDSGVGPGLLAKLKRGVVNATGSSAMGVDVTHMQMLDRDLHTIEAQAGALLLGGQGQVSDGERKMVHDSMPNMETNPEAIKNILNVLRAKAKRDALGLSISADGDTYPRTATDSAPSASHQTSSGVKWSIVH
jgi:hypothetical protein